MIAATLATWGCAAPNDDDLGAIEQDGTAAQDVDVRVLRQRFKDAHGLNSFSPAIRYKFVPPQSGVSYVPTTPYKSTRTWSCVERDARAGSAQKSVKTTYAFRLDGDERIKNIDAGFGKIFVRGERVSSSWGSELIGYPETNIAGALVTYDVVRWDSGDDDFERDARKTRPTLIIERVIQPATKRLSAADQSKLDELEEEYEASLSYADGLAIAYVACTSFTD